MLALRWRVCLVIEQVDLVGRCGVGHPYGGSQRVDRYIFLSCEDVGRAHGFLVAFDGGVLAGQVIVLVCVAFCLATAG